MNEITKHGAIEELKRLSKKSPAELWDEFPERQKFEEKVVVDYETVNDNPQEVYTQFIKYLQIPKRKPWIVDKLCKNLRNELGVKLEDLPNKKNDHDILENY